MSKSGKRRSSFHFVTRYFPVGLDEGAADVALAGLVGGHAAMGEVGVALGRQIISTPHPSPLPVRGGEGGEAHVVVLAKPVGVLEGRVGEELSFASQKTRRVASRLGIRAHARRGVGAVTASQGLAEQ